MVDTDIQMQSRYTLITSITHSTTSVVHPDFTAWRTRKLITGSWGSPWTPDFCLAMAAVVICISWIATDRAIQPLGHMGSWRATARYGDT